MEPIFYKTVSTRRSLTYNYYFSAPIAEKPVLLFLHGFPSTSYDWRYQVDFFKAQGFGIIVPDQLGYGGTDKPVDYADYRLSLISQDLIDILDAENVDKAIAIGHDWSVVNNISDLLFVLKNAKGEVDQFPDRFDGFAFLAVGYVPPSSTKFADAMVQVSEIVGYNPFGYWNFFVEEGAPDLIEKNFDSFYSLVTTDDHKVWRTDVAPVGALKAWVEGNRKTKPTSYVAEEEIEKQKFEILKWGISAPLNWYKVKVLDLDVEDSEGIPKENIVVQKPVFLAAALKDYVSLAALQKAATARFVKGPLTIKDFDAGHWVLWEEKDRVNDELLDWIKGLEL
ncbi:hypothetical protein H0H93_012959 [Arthromyces matolae]|nr:hypothetical protein H0H93_012959 [Arthromyces matolae]